MNTRRLMLFALLALVTLGESLFVRADKLDGTLNIKGGDVELVVKHKDGRPAKGVQVRLVYARQSTTAASATNDEGRWFAVVPRPGPYQVIVESQGAGEDDLRLAFTAMETTETCQGPWVAIALALVCMASVSAFLILGVRKPMPLALLTIAGFAFYSWAIWTDWRESGVAPVPAGPDVAQGAREYLMRHGVKPLSEPLERLLLNDSLPRIETLPHPLLGKAAPDFKLADHQQNVRQLNEWLRAGPVVLVFYYGYHCNHCVSQLFALHEDIARFHELGAEVIAVSADPPEWTKQRYRKYGEFAFPVLSDPENKAAQSYCVFRPASGKMQEDLQHGTFIIRKDGVIHWTQYGYEPFTGNHTLLHELARLQNRMPTHKAK